MRRWTINGRFLTQPVTGVQRYAGEIVRALDQLVAERHPLAANLALRLVAPEGVRADLGFRNIEVDKSGEASGHVWEQILLPRRVQGGLLSLANAGPLMARRHIVCIHDLNTRLAPQSYSWQFRMLYRGLLPALGRWAERIVTVSRFSADALTRYSIASAGRIRVAPNGCEHALAWQARHSQRSLSAAGPDTVLVIGSPVPHKNVGMLLALAPRLAEAGLRLAVIGTRDPHVFPASVPSIAAENILWLGRLTDEEMAALLGDCLCLAFPSVMEGFGLPPLEAMARGCPVVVSNVASLPEVCGDGALYAPPHEPDKWLERFLELRGDRRLRAGLVEQGHKSAARFSWRRSAEIYLEVMAEIDGYGSA